MGVPKRLTEMQMKFAHELVTNEGRKTATECAIAAGYSPDAAVVYASKLQSPKTYPLVVQYIGELRNEYQKNTMLHFNDTYQNSQNYEIMQENQKHGQPLLMQKLHVVKLLDYMLNKR